MDLCHPALHPRIHCDKVSADAYDVTNLVSADLRVRARGFRAEYFIKPPVHVILSFPFHIHIHRIDIDPCVGSNVSLGLQILTHSAASIENWLVDNKPGSTSASFNSTINPEIFHLVGRAFLEERQFLCFKNNRYSSRHPFVGKDFLPGTLEGNVYETNLWQKSLASLSKVSHLMVRIVRTQSASIPVLRSIRVYGQPSAACHKDVISLVYRISQHLKPPPVEDAPSSVQSPPCKEEEVQDAARNMLQDPSEETPRIPLEYLDEITLELMALPMMLPSGHSVDQLTLDKHSQSEEVWGRPPSDPFTGVPYTRHSYPIPNTALKVRIDKFLLQEGKHLSNVSRTVGRRTRLVAQNSTIANQNMSHSETSHTLQTPSTSNTVHSTARQVSKRCIKSSDSASMSNHAPKVSEVNASQCTQDSSSENLTKRCSDVHLCDLSESCRKRPKITDETHKPYSRSHEEALSQSLDAALARTLGSIPTFKRRRKEPAVGQVAASSLVNEHDNRLHINKGIHGNMTPTAGPSGISCCRCNSPAAQNSCNLLQLPCQHLMCRRCLLQVQQERTLVCSLCQKNFQTGDVVTVHL
ncbi:RING finger protein 37-like [Branchiostoma lanceolatum]|uniref:RING finger protein 37-like n=1 Tax=Branchiostoma lanceolatum TaxID=7740 RepID=UPI00345238F5